MENPLDWKAIEAVAFHSNLSIEPVMAPLKEIEANIDTNFSGLIAYNFTLDEFESEIEDTPVQHIEEVQDSDNVVVKLVNKIIIDAHRRDASDIHIEPCEGKEKTIIRIRKDGTLMHYYDVPPSLIKPLIARIKIMAGLDISEKRKPQDGKIDFKRFGDLNVELRVATIPTVGGQEDVVMRLLAAGTPIAVDKLGLSESNYKCLLRIVDKPYGLFFVCGPTGSGKTTTLHSILGHLNKIDTKIWTVEDPVEITQRGLRQVQVQPKIDLTFAQAMRAFLRADPDIIMVGEMRDMETTSMGVEASLTGHLVLSTLHTNSAPESITRLLDMGMDPFNFADALLGILAQRLTKRLCVSCRKSYKADDIEVKDMLTEFCTEKVLKKKMTKKDTETLYENVLNDWLELYQDGAKFLTLNKAVGCDQCDQSGYSGRIAIHEILEVSDVIKHQIHEGAKVSELLASAIKGGMQTLKQDGIEKVLQGHTDMFQVRRVCIK